MAALSPFVLTKRAVGDVGERLHESAQRPRLGLGTEAVGRDTHQIEHRRAELIMGLPAFVDDAGPRKAPSRAASVFSCKAWIRGIKSPSAA